MGDEPVKPKRKAKTEDVPDKKPRLDPSVTTFEVQPEVENFQREALWRSLQDYKRRAIQSQEHLEKLRRTSAYHDEHLRVIDVWWDQLVDEAQLLIKKEDSEPSQNVNGSLEAHFLDTLPEFAKHLTAKRQGILNGIVQAIRIVQNKERGTPIDADLDWQVRDLSARLKVSEMNLRSLQAEKEQREPKITDLQEKLASSQRKVDRQKSITLARIEQQARRGLPPASPESNVKTEDDMSISTTEAKTTEVTNGTLSTMQYATLQTTVESQLKELNELQIRLAESLDRNSVLKKRADFPHASDVEKSDVYIILRKANEHLRGENEYLEKRNHEITQECTALNSERSTFQETLTTDHATQYSELSLQLVKAEQDLARVRSARDELHSSLQIRKGLDDAQAASAREISELADTQATRIAALESEVARLKQEYETEQSMNGEGHQNGHASVEELVAQLEQLQKENQSLKKELPTMEHAFNQAHEQNMRKIMDLASAEDRASRLQAEKSKADQKYFAAMKAKDQLTIEVRALKAHIAKSTETIGRLQEADESAKQKIANLEQQTTLLAASSAAYQLELTKGRAKADELTIQRDTSEARLKTVDATCDGKEKEMAVIVNTKRTLSKELEDLKAQYEAAKHAAQPLVKGAGDSDQVLVYKGIAMCSVCSTRWKNTALTSCGHVFCKECVDKRVETRQRRCPNCNKGFGSGDVLAVHL